MKKTFKKLTAALMAVASLAVGVTGIGASAANDGISPLYQGPTGYVNIGGSAKASTYVDSAQINLGTEDTKASSVTVKLSSAAYTTLNGTTSTIYTGETSASLNYKGSGIKYADGYHTATEGNTTYKGSTHRTVG